jgi:hypothetical protein
MRTIAASAIAAISLLASSLITGMLLGGGPVMAATLCGDPDPPLVADLKLRQAPSLSESAARVPFRDPIFQTCQVRLTDRAADIAPGDNSGGLKNEYSRVQAFNADESAILIRSTAITSGSPGSSSRAPLAKRWRTSDSVTRRSMP